MGHKDVNNMTIWDYEQTQNRLELRKSRPRLNLVYKKVAKYIKKNNSTIVEIGFGDGYLVRKLGRKYQYVIGVDISKPNIDLAKNSDKKNKYKLMKEDGKLPLKDNSIDCLVASEVIEHMSNSELNNFKNELKRVLKKNGYFIGTVPACENLNINNCICPNCQLKYHKKGHKQRFTRKNLIRKIDVLKLISVEYCFNRYTGNNFLEYFVGYSMYILRKLIVRLIRLESAGFIFVYKK